MDRRRKPPSSPSSAPPLALAPTPPPLSLSSKPASRSVLRTLWPRALPHLHNLSIPVLATLLILLLLLLLMSQFLIPNPTSRLPSHPPAPVLASEGSAKQLQLLLQNISAHAHRANPSAPPSTLLIAVAVNYAYRNLALNFVCNLHRLRLSNYLVLAMDRPVYDYLSQRHVHVFYHDLRTTSSAHTPLTHNNSHIPSHPRRHSIRRPLSLVPHRNRSHPDVPHRFGTPAFIETSRRKSLLVLRILTLGYSVLFSDVDVVWISNPIPHILPISSHFVFQSDRSYSHPHLPPNYNLNSGFYLARAVPQTIVAMRAIIKYAYAIRRSEQKAFNYVLCGAFKDHHAGPGTRIGATQCKYPNSGATAKTLPLDAFPNGSNHSLWNPSTNFVHDHPTVVVAHANYVEGREEKITCIRHIGFWFHSQDATTRDECVLPTT